MARGFRIHKPGAPFRGPVMDRSAQPCAGHIHAMSSSRGLNDRNKVSLRYTDGKKKAPERINGVRTIPDVLSSACSYSHLSPFRLAIVSRALVRRRRRRRRKLDIISWWCAANQCHETTRGGTNRLELMVQVKSDEGRELLTALQASCSSSQ